MGKTISIQENGKEYKLYTNRYIQNENTAGILFTLLSAEHLDEQLASFNNKITKKSIETLFNYDTHSHYFTNNRKDLLLTQNDDSLIKLFGPLTKISSLQALKDFGLENMELAREKVYVRCKK